MAGLVAEVNFFKVPTKLENAYGVNVGWFEDQKYKDDLTIAQVARWQEFGTKAGVPRRPFMYQAIMKYEKEWMELLKTMVQRAIDENKNIDTALKKFGEKAKGDIQETILSGSFTPNAPITVRGGWMKNKATGKPVYIEGKGFNQPLVDTGIMVSSIQARTDKELLDV